MIDEARARGIVLEAGGPELAERLDHLDATRAAGAKAVTETAPQRPERGESTDVDVIVAGGGLWLLLAPILAERGLRVAVLDRARAGQSHREWNASRSELEALVRAGIVDTATLESLLVARYDYGTCRFAGGGSYPVRDVLDCAVDAGGLLAHARRLAEARGVFVCDGHSVVSQSAGEGGVRARVRRRDGVFEMTARVMVDARGAASPYATADLVCPTVGGVMTGLAEGDAPDEVDPRVGDILATVDGIEDGRQHVWEGFPGRPGENTVYLFYYARAGERVSLLELYARFFDRLSTYKRGDARLSRPTFGLIPGWSRLSPAPRAPHPRVVLVGDAAARHSPLTYCGFGATLRSLEPAAAHVTALATGAPMMGPALDDAPVHALTGALAHMMASRRFEGAALNQLLDAAFATLHEMGDEAYAALLRDEMAPSAFVSFLRRTASRHPSVWGDVLRGLGPRICGAWGLGVARTLLREAS